MKAKDLDELFDNGEVNITSHLKLSEGHRPAQEQKRGTANSPNWQTWLAQLRQGEWDVSIDELEKEASQKRPFDDLFT